MRVVFPPLLLRTADTHVFAHMHTPMYMHSGTYKYVSAHTRARSQAMVSPFLLGPPIGSSGHGGNMGVPLGSLMCPSQVMSMSTVKTDCWGEGTWLPSPPSQAGQSQPLETEQDGWQRGPQPWRGSWVLHPQWTGAP